MTNQSSETDSEQRFAKDKGYVMYAAAESWRNYIMRVRHRAYEIVRTKSYVRNRTYEIVRTKSCMIRSIKRLC